LANSNSRLELTRFGAALVFLDLLERQPDGITDGCLTHAQQRAALPHSGANVNIDTMCGHLWTCESCLRLY